MERKVRMSNFEMLRIFTMIMIIACHIVTHGMQQAELGMGAQIVRKIFLGGGTSEIIFLF